jgi:hypothetical protein
VTARGATQIENVVETRHDADGRPFTHWARGNLKSFAPAIGLRVMSVRDFSKEAVA